MTIPITANRVQYVATASQTIFPYTWRVNEAAHLVVYVGDLLKTLSTHYNVTGVGTEGGNVVFATGQTVGSVITIIGQIPFNQDVDYQDHNPFPANTNEAGLDKLTRMAQQLQEQINRGLLFAPHSAMVARRVSDPVPGQVLQWDADGNIGSLLLTTQTGLVGDVIPVVASALGLPAPGQDGRMHFIETPPLLAIDQDGAWHFFTTLGELVVPASTRGTLPDPTLATGRARYVTDTPAGISVSDGSTWHEVLLDGTIHSSTTAGLGAPTLGRIRSLTDGFGGIVAANGSSWGHLSSPVYRLEDVNGADMAAKIANLMSFIPSTGGVIDARAFVGIQNNTSTITITKPCEVLLGDVDIRSSASVILAIVNPGNSVCLRGSGRAMTYLNLMTATQRGISVQSNQAVLIADMAIQQNTVATDGCAIYLDGATHAVTSGQAVTLRELHLPNHWDAVYVDASANFLIDRCFFVNPRRSGVNLRNIVTPDEGDSTIMSCSFTEGGGGNNVYGIYQEDSGGLRVLNNKFNGFAYAYAMDIKNNTAVLVISGNSIEGQRLAGLLFTRSSGNAGFQPITITGNEFGVMCTAINVDTSGVVDVFFNGIIAGNTITTGLTSGSAVRFANGKDWGIYGNLISSFGGTTIGIDIGSATDKIHVGQNTFVNVPTPLNDNGPTSIIHPNGVRPTSDGQVGLLVQRNVGGVVTVQQVFMGAADSGGAGYRMLRTLN